MHVIDVAKTNTEVQRLAKDLIYEAHPTRS